ncbi:MAG: DUF11 domain-containing protein [Planctomycetes bacterium]|nr:DUF11 domain-containing protein [Planctomycetota bacterium]
MAIAVTGLGLLGALWAVHAQDGKPLFAPPAVLPKDGSQFPHQTQPLRDKKKGDATLIVPPEVYDEPRPVGPEPTEIKGGTLGLVQVEATGPLPLLPPMPKEEKGPNILLPLPAMEVQPLPDPLPLPMPILEPTKALIVEPAVKEVPVKKAPVPEVVLPAPLVIPMPKPLAPAPLTSAPPIVQKPRAFVRIESVDRSAPPLTLQPGPIVAPPSSLDPGDGAIASVQTPVVTVRKLGPASYRAGETVSYTLVVRNHGAAPAQQIRIEDEIPANAKPAPLEPVGLFQGNKAVWVLSDLAAGTERILKFTVHAGADGQSPGNTTVHVSSANAVTTTVLRPRNDGAVPTVQLVGPASVSVGKPAVFEIRVANSSAQPMTTTALYGWLPDGLSHPEGAEIKGEVETTIAPGETKTLKMPTTAVKQGRYAVRVKVATSTGEASATTEIEITGESLHLHQAPTLRLFPGRDGDMRIEVTNHTNKPMRNVQIADRLPDGLDFVDASSRGLYQANSRVVYWLIDELPAGKAQTLVVRVHCSKAGDHANVVFAKADGVAELHSTGVVKAEGVADLTLRVVERDNPLELGKQTVYEITVHSTGHAAATQVQLKVDFPKGIVPTKAEGDARFALDRQGVVFEPVASLGPQGQATFRVSALAQGVGDQRVRFSVVSEQVRVPVLREISVKVYP